MRVNCDTCGKPFIIMAQSKEHSKGIIETFFVCPHCNRHYTSAVTNHAVRKKIDELKKLRTKGRPDDEKNRKRYDARVAKLKADIDQGMGKLKRKVCGKNG
ncbi:hypothetical protein MOD72_11985 [Bacillus haynesii]|uniref:hypothetical protein n=1 Tax=Bacillus haynesii TaxID=1925021 RepID=UPI0022813953|nr:hypothetical protein [Bacillus haynesii]MCY8609896.1 hypothetical protein [Bacillus haynesii]MEC0752128.1 hypothetical protein [Bacillus haynesii]